MTERISSPQLLKLVQAAGPGYSLADPEWVKKFAELIVGECAKKIQIHKTRIQANAEYMRGHNDACDDAVSIIKKHFGVE